MLRVGLTGGLASGKSTVGRVLAELGAAVFDADEIVHELYAPGSRGAAVVVELFGVDLLDRYGAVDREMLAREVFANPEKRRRLEEAIHPLVITELGRRFSLAEEAGARVAVGEAAQILESPYGTGFDRILLVVAPASLRLQRAEDKGLDRGAARARMVAQMPADRAQELADDVIVNDGTEDDLRKKVAEVWRKWTG